MSHIDANYLQKLYKADQGLIEKMKHTFLLHGADSLNNLLEFVKTSDFEKLDFDLHKFRSQCQSTGILKLDPYFLEVIHLSKTESVENTNKIIATLKEIKTVSETVLDELKNDL